MNTIMEKSKSVKGLKKLSKKRNGERENEKIVMIILIMRSQSRGSSVRSTSLEGLRDEKLLTTRNMGLFNRAGTWKEAH